MKRLVVYVGIDFSNYFKTSQGIDFKDALLGFLNKSFGEGVASLIREDEYNFEIEIKDNEAVEKTDIVGAVVEFFGLKGSLGRDINISCYNLKPDIFSSFFKKKNAPVFNEQVSLYKGLNDHLLEVVAGQDYAISTIVNGFIETKLFKNNKGNKPLLTFLLAGPQKTGKTFIAEQTVEFLKMPYLELYPIDYSDERTFNRIRMFINRHPNGAIIFNDIEEFSLDFTRMMYAAMMTGEVEGISFRGLTIFLTTRCGRSLYENSPRKNLSHLSKADIIDSCGRDTNKLSGYPMIHPVLLSVLANEHVVMLNHHEAINIQLILSNYIQSYCEEFTKKTGIKISLDSFELARFVLYKKPDEDDIDVFKKDAEDLINKELEYLVKQSSDDGQSILSKIATIEFKIDLEDANEAVKELFKSRTYRVVVACSNEEMAIIKKAKIDNVEYVQIRNVLDLKEEIKKGVDLLLIDPLYHIRDKKLPVDIEDYNSEGMDIFNYANRYYGKLLLDIISNVAYEKRLNSYQSLLNKGANDILYYSKYDVNKLQDSIYASVISFELERDLESLSRNNIHLTYNAAHAIGEETIEVNLTKLALEQVDIFDFDVEEEALRKIRGFDDIIGSDIAKEYLIHISRFLSSTPEYLQSGLQPPKLVLINGYPGIGKTALVKALSEETGASIIKIDGKQIIIDGENGIDAVREAFKKARYSSPSIVHFVNINVIISASESAASIRMLETLNKELSYSAKDVNHPVVCIGECDPSWAVNEKLKDSATRYFILPLLNIEERERYIKKYLEDKHITNISDKAIHNLALRIYYGLQKTFDYIARALEFAIVFAQDKGLNDETLKDSYDAFCMGDLSNLKHNEEEEISTSYHEIGHYLLGRLFGEHPVFVTVVPRAYYGGYTLSEISDVIKTDTKQDYLNRICVSFGGRAAEVIYNKGEKGINAGISGDINSATRVAKIMITQCAMGKKLAAYDQDEVGYNSVEIYQEINEILEEQYKRAIRLLELNRKNLDILSMAIYKNKSMTGDELEELVPNDKLILEK